MQNDHVIFPETGPNLGLQTAAVTWLDLAELRSVVVNGEDTPGVIAAKQSTQGHLQYPWTFPDDGNVSKVEMTILHRPSKGIAVHKQANDDIMHLRRL
jgi:hypothetical protein